MQLAVQLHCNYGIEEEYGDAKHSQEGRSDASSLVSYRATMTQPSGMASTRFVIDAPYRSDFFSAHSAYNP